MTVELIKTDVNQGMVLYTDGGCRPNPGFPGFGVHGYLYEKIAPKKGSGHPTHIPSAQGYVPKADKAKVNEVKLISYIDGFGSCMTTGTNNTAEVLGASHALHKAKDYAIDELSLFIDSQYVIKGITEWAPIWVARNWVKADGQAVQNSQEWKTLLSAYNELVGRGVKININWVKGHNGDVGNEKADGLATIGVIHSTKSINVVEMKESTAEGYWKNNVEKHPFVSARRMYFNTVASSFVAGEYYMGDHGKDDELLGKKVSDGALCVIQLKEPDSVLETLRNYEAEIANGEDFLVMARLDKVYTPEMYDLLSNYGGRILTRPDLSRLDLNCPDKDPLIKQLKPARIAMRSVTELIQLQNLLNRFKDKDANIESLDITDILYNTKVVEKKGITTTSMELKPEYNTGFASLPVDFKTTTEDKNYEINLILTLGIDMLDRNAFKRLESLNPKITLIVWKEAATVLRYATVVEAQGSYGIWAGVYSNMRFIDPSKAVQ